jgi:hypothetical protein
MSLGDILNAQMGFLPVGRRVPLEKIKEVIARRRGQKMNTKLTSAWPKGCMTM